VDRPFDLAARWPARFLLVREESGDHLLLIVLHHIASDGWSGSVLLRDLAESYVAAREGRPPRLPRPAIRYADFAAWQRTAVAGRLRARQLAYWRETLDGAADRADGPVDRTDGPVDGGEGAVDRPGGSVPLRIGAELRDRLAAIAAEEFATLFTALHTGFAELLHRQDGRPDVVIGTDVSGRERPQTADVVGPFVNQLVLRLDLSGAPTRRGLLRRAAAVGRAALAHQDVPYEQVVRELRDAGRAGPLFRHKIVYEESALPDRLGDLRLQHLNLAQQTAKFDLTLFLWNGADGVDGVLQYARDRFDEPRAAALAAAYVRLLEAMATDANARVAVTATEERTTDVDDRHTSGSRVDRFRKAAPRAVRVTGDDPASEGGLPLVVSAPAAREDLAAFAGDRSAWIDEKLVEHGAVLFRGFGVRTPEQFEAVAARLCGELFEENGEHTPVLVGGHVQTPVFYPPERQLLWHNENSFNATWPRRLVFCCVDPADEGGETPLVDGREVYRRLDPALRARFEDKQVMYVRMHQPGLGLTWQQVYGTDDRAEVERRCAEEGFGFSWLDGDRLRTTCVRPAVIAHPDSGEPCWFTQAQHWHPSCLDEPTLAALRAAYGDGLPRDCRYGDGSPIADEDMAAILAVYRELEVAFPWREGDVLVVDNVATAHGRNPYRGSRRLLVALGDPTPFHSAVATAAKEAR
jgi:alpha-ketoglutarate-dependent taurine dioxygenase